MAGRKARDTRIAAAARRTGLRRVAWVRITPGVHPVCEVSGIGHRIPRIRAVPLPVALDLIAAGVPLVVRRQPVGAPTEAA